MKSAGSDALQAMTKQSIRVEIERLVAEYQQRSGLVTEWRTPLVGFASADDPLFEKLREVASPTHAHPSDLLPGARTVVAFFIPLGKRVAQSNIRGEHASREWAQAYIETNVLIEEVGRHMQRLLGPGEDVVAVTPATHNFDPVRLVSDWSHRHVAFIAGPGACRRTPFGLRPALAPAGLRCAHSPHPTDAAQSRALPAGAIARPRYPKRVPRQAPMPLRYEQHADHGERVPREVGQLRYLAGAGARRPAGGGVVPVPR